MASGLRSSRQKKPMRRLALGIFLAIGVALMLAQTAPQIANMFNPVRTSVNDQVVGNTETFGFWAKITGQAQRENRIRELEREVRDLSRWQAAAISMVERMETYENILNLQGEPPATGVTARVVAESDGPFSETLLANAGQNQGVEGDFVAVNEAGLVGRVIGLGERSSRILLITDFNSKVPVLGEVSGARAIMQGGRDRYGLLTDLPEDAGFVAGERMLTSGEGGTFPRGILVGRAAAASREWRVILAKDDVQSGFVRLLPSQDIPTPEEAPAEVPEDLSLVEAAQ